jgi:c-di-GMP-binding flagellar brake protein YcgR
MLNEFPAQFDNPEPLLQRRRHARVQAPLGRPCVAQFAFLGRRRQFAIEDVSTGGIGMRASPRDAGGLNIGTRLTNVVLDLGQRERLVVDLEIRMRREMRTFLLGPQAICGCVFLDPPEQVLRLVEQAMGLLRGDVDPAGGRR